jgi:hypothetical protein
MGGGCHRSLALRRGSRATAVESDDDLAISYERLDFDEETPRQIPPLEIEAMPLATEDVGQRRAAGRDETTSALPQT